MISPNMIRYITIVFIINIYGSSFGGPLKVKDKAPLNILLQSISSNCKNSYLSSQIETKLKDCTVSPSPPYSVKQIQCLMFLDMNYRLCSAMNMTKDKIEQTYESSIKANLSIYTLCSTTKDWEFSNISIYPDYYSEVRSIRNNTLVCSRICGEEDVTNFNSNFYCKFYNWGLGILNSPENSTKFFDKNNEKMGSKSSIIDSSASGLKNTPSISPSTSVINTEITSNIEHSPDSGVLTASSKDATAKDFTNLGLSTSELASTKQLLASGNARTVQEVQQISNTGPNPVQSESTILLNQKRPLLTDIKTIETKNTDASDIEITRKYDSGNTIDESKYKHDTNKESLTDTAKLPIEGTKKQSVVETSQSKVADDAAEQKLVDNPDISQEGAEKPIINILDTNQPEQTAPKSILQADTDDFADAEEGKDGPEDTPVGDDDSEPENLLDEPKVNEQKLNTLNKADVPLSPLFIDSDQKEMLVQDQDPFEEDEDHFFPFFLTSVIIVVALYVLYHNKSKVSKLVLGLLVEGRQAGRRRNSRGHAYRRLDTLEQAMNDKTSAPPSKIIY